MKKLITLLLLPLFFISCEDEKTVFVADHYGVNQSFLIKEKQNEEWVEHAAKIEGFDYQEGYTYQIKVKIEKQDNDSLKYTLVSVEAKTKTDYLEKQAVIKAQLEKNWEVVQLTSFDNKTGKTPYFTIKNERITGNTGCNDFEGNFIIKTDEMFNIERLNATKKYCKPFMELESAFMGILSKATQFKLVDNTLSFLDKAGNTLFTAQEKKTANLSGKWIVSKIEGFKNNTNKSPYFSIKDGNLNGNTGCNNVGGPIEIDAKGLFKMGARILTTRRFCKDYATLEQTFVKALRAAATYKLVNGKLLVSDEFGNLLFTATKENAATNNRKTTVVEYNTYSQDLAIRNKLEGKQLVYYDLRPTPTKPTKVILSDEDYTFVTAEIAKLDLSVLAKLTPPSTGFKTDTASGATLIVTKDSKLVRVPTFDHGNPPKELKALIAKIMELRNQ